MTRKAEPVVQSLEASIGKSVTRLEVYRSETNKQRYIQSGGLEKCGGVPFFYNDYTKSTVCGAREIAVLQRWAQEHGPNVHR